MLDVIGVGFGRTGTLSLKNALETLGFGPCHHMLGMFDRPSEIPRWRQAAEGGPVDWEEVYAGYRATVDWPGAGFWQELVARYPDARVVLTVREPRSWYESALNTIYASMLPPDNGSDPVFTQLREMSDLVVWQGVFGGRFADREHALAVYRKHREDVLATVSPDRLLVYDVSEGWEPLCSHLGVPVPDVEFPRLNDRGRFTDLIDEHTTTS